jgi:DNA-binding MarR family transcriptional regulator
MMALQLVPPIHRATHRVGLYLADLGERGLSQGESHVLARLATARRATIADLHADLAHRRSTLTSILDRLESGGLVTREVGVEDRRTFIVVLTARGRTLARQVHEHLSALERAVSARVSGADLVAFTKVIAAVEAEAARLTRAGRTPRQKGPARGRRIPTASR